MASAETASERPTIIHACSFSDGVDYRIVVDEREWRFDFSDRFGPLFQGKHGRDLKNPPTNLALWRAVTLWLRQGKRVDGGLCIWNEPPPIKVERIIGRHCRILPAKEQDPGTDDEFSQHVIVRELTREQAESLLATMRASARAEGEAP